MPVAGMCYLCACMCTVTFLPVGDKIFLTSNRDEQTSRLPASQPVVQQFPSGQILFPRDGQAGGTWIGLHSNGNAMVLLNGAFERHMPSPPYRKSRGLIFLEVLDAWLPQEKFEEIDLDGIEPFTLVACVHHTLWEMRWDGKMKYIAQKPIDIPQIWSSALLYDKEVIEKREQWFNEWLAKHPLADINENSIRSFHHFGGEGDKRTDLLMNRNGFLQTVSITGMELKPANANMYYEDIITGEHSFHEWHFETNAG